MNRFKAKFRSVDFGPKIKKEKGYHCFVFIKLQLQAKKQKKSNEPILKTRCYRRTYGQTEKDSFIGPTGTAGGPKRRTNRKMRIMNTITFPFFQIPSVSLF